MRRISADAVAYAAPLVIILALYAIYRAAPDFYHRWVLEFHRRESQAVEILTVTFLAVAVFPLSWATLKLWRSAAPPSPGELRAAPTGLAGLIDRRSGALFVTLILLATIVFLGEEINWGQTILLWLDPTRKLPRQSNLHNNLDGFSFQGLGSMGLACAFFVAPLLWHLFRRPLHLPMSLRPAIAEGPVIACLAIATVWKWMKNLYVSTWGRSRDDALYWGFVEQINEQKELLVALSLLLYGLYRMPAVRSWLASPADDERSRVPARPDALSTTAPPASHGTTAKAHI